MVHASKEYVQKLQEDFAWVHLTQMYSISTEDNNCPIGNISYHNYNNLKTYAPLLSIKKKKDMKVVFRCSRDVYGNENGNGGALFHQERKKAKTKENPLHPDDEKMQIELSPVYIKKTMMMLEHYTESETVKTLLNPLYSNDDIKKIMEYVKATTMYVTMLYRAFKPNDTAEGLYFPTVHEMGTLAFEKTKAMLSKQNLNSKTFNLFPENVTISLKNASEALASVKETHKKLLTEKYLENQERKKNHAADDGSSDENSSSEDDDSDSSDDE